MLTPVIKEILNRTEAMPGLKVRGWVKTRRDSKACTFAEINDGSCRANLQAVFPNDNAEINAELEKVTPGCSVEL
ncbi:MAG: asparagine--tRNA ligase, partial [Elusimicrobiales bacterium]|nr:asparagine--tRNA ligase [Elusimicrobiales bacterium]